jgi:hypothetical protein
MIEVTSASTGNLPRSSEADAAVDGRLTCRYAAQIPFCQSSPSTCGRCTDRCHHLPG